MIVKPLDHSVHCWVLLSVLVFVPGHFRLVEVKRIKIGLRPYLLFELRYGTSAYCVGRIGRK